jgi:hypothetical protein
MFTSETFCIGQLLTPSLPRVDRMWEGDLAREWHPKESLLDLMISCSSLSHRLVISRTLICFACLLVQYGGAAQP